MIDRLKLLRGVPIPCNGLNVIPLTLGQIEEMGEIEYNKRLNLLLIDTNKFIDHSFEIEGVTDYDVFLQLITQDEEILEFALSALELFTDKKFIITRDGLSYVDNNDRLMLFTANDFDLMRRILSYQNYLDEPNVEERKVKPANKKAEELMRKRDKYRKEIQEKNRKDRDSLHLADIISIVACYSKNVNLNTIWDYTIYQLYEEYVRLSLWDEYHNLQILLPYINQEENQIETKHWGIKVTPKILKEE